MEQGNKRTIFSYLWGDFEGLKAKVSLGMQKGIFFNEVSTFKLICFPAYNFSVL
jgi:hypothetical protein